MARSVLLAVGAFALTLCAEGSFGTPRPREGLASWYGDREDGRLMANGCIFHARNLIAASRSLPMGTWLLVTNLANNRTIMVEVQDRGPYIGRRVLDLSLGAARALDFVAIGLTPVAFEVLPHRDTVSCRHKRR